MVISGNYGNNTMQTSTTITGELSTQLRRQNYVNIRLRYRLNHRLTVGYSYKNAIITFSSTQKADQHRYLNQTIQLSPDVYFITLHERCIKTIRNHLQAVESS